jgi:hypothetical protein
VIVLFEKMHQALVDNAESIINPMALLLSCGLLIYFYTAITDAVLFKIIFSIAAIYVDILAWLTWGRAHTYTEVSKKAEDNKLKLSYQSRAFGLRICTILYLIACSGPADVSFFMSELSTKEQAAQEVQDTNQAVKERIAQIDMLVKTYNKALDIEVDTSYRKKSEELDGKIGKLSAERAELLTSLNRTSESSQTSKELFKNPFQSLAVVLGLKPNALKAIAFIVLVFMIQLGLLLTPWEVKLKANLVTNSDESVTTPEEAMDEVAAGESITDELESNIDADTKELLTFIGAAYKPGGGRALYGDWVISQKTGIPIQKCAEYKKILSRANINGKPLVVRRQGGSEAQFPKEIVEARVKKGV